VAFPVFFDTCAIYDAGLADLLLTMAENGLFRPLWSDNVLAELRDALVEAGIDEDGVEHRIASMNDTFPDARVTGYEALIPQMDCNEDDRHVLAAAARSGAAVLVTFNLKHFPMTALADYELTVVHPDEFLLDQLDLYQAKTVEAVIQVTAQYENPPVTIAEFLDLLKRSGVPKFAKAVSAVV